MSNNVKMNLKSTIVWGCDREKELFSKNFLKDTHKIPKTSNLSDT